MAGFWISLICTFFVVLLGIFILGDEKGKEKYGKRIDTDGRDGIKKHEQMCKEEKEEEKDCKTEQDIQLFETVIIEKQTKDEKTIITDITEEMAKIVKDEEILSEKEEIISIEKIEETQRELKIEENEMILTQNNTNIDEQQENIPIDEQQKITYEAVKQEESAKESNNFFEPKKGPIIEELSSTEMQTPKSMITESLIQSTELTASTVFVSNDTKFEMKTVDNDANNNSLPIDQSGTFHENDSINKISESLNDSTNLPIESKEDHEDSEWHLVSNVQSL